MVLILYVPFGHHLGCDRMVINCDIKLTQVSFVRYVKSAKLAGAILPNIHVGTP